MPLERLPIAYVRHENAACVRAYFVAFEMDEPAEARVENRVLFNVLAHLLGQTLTFETDMTFNPPTELSENDLYDEGA